MKKTIALLLCLSLLLCCFAGCQGTEKNQVINLLTYEGYIPDSVAAAFTKETGIKINLTPISSNEELYEKLKSSPDLYDLVIASDYMLDTMIAEDMLLSLDKSKLQNFGNLNPDYMGQYYDPADEYTIPYSAGRPLIVYDPEKVSLNITSYADLWDASLLDSIVMIDDMRVVTGITLLSMGYGMNETDPEILSAALEKLKALKPNVKVFTSNYPEQSLVSGDASVGFMFSASAALLSDSDKEFKIVYPSEGLGFGIDCLAVSKQAPHADNTYRLLDYLLQPEVGADVSEQILYLCCNKAAEAYLSDAYKSNPALFISEEFKDAGFILSLDEAANKLYSDNWTLFKNS